MTPTFTGHRRPQRRRRRRRPVACARRGARRYKGYGAASGRARTDSSLQYEAWARQARCKRATFVRFYATSSTPARDEQAAKWPSRGSGTAKRRSRHGRHRRKPDSCTAGSAAIGRGGAPTACCAKGLACQPRPSTRRTAQRCRGTAAAWGGRVRRAGAAPAAAAPPRQPHHHARRGAAGPCACRRPRACGRPERRDRSCLIA